jgi:Ion channel
LYLHFGAIRNQEGKIVTSWVDALYFSSTTMLTVGFGDLTPLAHSGRLLILFQYASLIVFLLLMLPLVLSVFSDLLVTKEFGTEHHPAHTPKNPENM